MQNHLSRRTWVIPGLVAAILFAGALASNLVASDLQTTLKPYRSWVWLTCAVSIIFTVAAAIVEARRRAHSSVSNAEEVTDHPEKVGTRNAIGERSVAVNGNVEGSTMIPGNRNVVGGKIDGDMVARDKVTYTINQAASTAINALHQLRAPVGDFVGRELEINALVNSLRRNSRAWITGISGMGGIGKTELALIVAERLALDYPDAQFFINLQGTDTNPRPPQEVLATCIRAFLGPEARLPEDLDQLSQLYLSQLSGKRVLLLLDNAADSAQVRHLLPPPGSALLVTSRDAIALPNNTTNAQSSY